jgi:hypothetical protein
MLKTISTLLAASLVVALAGCSAVPAHDRRDAPWDPKPGQTLFDQIPNWEGGANRVCCGHLRTCQAHQTPRC